MWAADQTCRRADNSAALVCSCSVTWQGLCSRLTVLGRNLSCILPSWLLWQYLIKALPAACLCCASGTRDMLLY
jgi:hypothetical protein